MAMTPEHKAALAQGRKEARAIKAYLNALHARKPGRPVTRESLEGQIAAIDARIADHDDPLRVVELVQKRLDLENRLGALGDQGNFEDLEAGFVGSARSYSDRKGISYTAWREIGVPAVTLKAAGVAERRRR